MSEKLSHKSPRSPLLITQIINVLQYYDAYSYPPTAGEIRRYLQIKATEEELEVELKHLYSNGKVKKSKDRFGLSNKIITNQKARIAPSSTHMKYLEKYAEIFKIMPWVSLLGVSGSLSMMDSSSNDDIDVFIITKSGRIWTTRCLVLILKKIFILFHFPYSSKLCFNLFFTEDNMSVPNIKRGIYTAHEVLQMKPIINKNKIYERFLSENNWVEKIFPNVHINSIDKYSDFKLSRKSNTQKTLDDFLQKLQVIWLKHKKVAYTLFPGQAWLLLDTQKYKSKK